MASNFLGLSAQEWQQRRLVVGGLGGLLGGSQTAPFLLLRKMVTSALTLCVETHLMPETKWVRRVSQRWGGGCQGHADVAQEGLEKC